jgi:hypothetical protein
MHELLARLLERTYCTAEREVIYRLLRGGGQVRHFAADPIPTETLQRILNAALDAPFVGGMPPRHLIVVTSPAVRTRIAAAVAAGHARDASLRPGGRGATRSSARERLAEAPLHLAVTYDRGGGRRARPSPEPLHGHPQHLWGAAEPVVGGVCRRTRGGMGHACGWGRGCTVAGGTTRGAAPRLSRARHAPSIPPAAQASHRGLAHPGAP